jgi:hypothetical protein
MQRINLMLYALMNVKPKQIKSITAFCPRGQRIRRVSKIDLICFIRNEFEESIDKIEKIERHTLCGNSIYVINGIYSFVKNDLENYLQEEEKRREEQWTI